ncbi:N-acetylmuramic acid 6-phosphate etherase [Acetobacteraceae bacterium KSS8]|uniref:N-acetylmuramic acid 6-phosphate etherase n=1 Tax=Endosaccharibacter trunci TaxID=2812733 RepID=A0ABT1W7L0_9PROT|nr:N-acetylmuramic acid 6-phosphate etherase [Acetobacteraceae bacterium KSS8]
MAIPPAATEQVSRRHAALDSWTVRDQVESLWEGQLAAVAAIGPALPAIAAAVEAALPRLRDGGRLCYAGAGSSGRLGAQDGAELEPTFNWPRDRLVLLVAGGLRALTEAVENAEDDRDSALAQVADAAIGAQDVLIGVAASGGTPFTVAAIREARARGALTIGLANSPHGALLDASEHPVFVATGAEPIAGSTRMKAGTAQKIVLNLLSTAMMTGLGRVHQGRMVDMQARNQKLRRRAVAMVSDLAGCDAERAAQALERAGGQVKPAILVALGLGAEEASLELDRTGGHLRPVLDGLASRKPTP